MSSLTTDAIKISNDFSICGVVYGCTRGSKWAVPIQSGLNLAISVEPKSKKHGNAEERF
jgi:hypothetical protein